MSRKANEERAKRIEQYYIRHGKDKKKTYLHFMDEGLSKKTVYHIMRRHDQRGDVSFKKPTGRRVTVCTPEMFEKLANIFKENPDLSCREAAKQLGVARTTIFRIMAKMREKNLETYKVIESEPRCPTCHQRIDKSMLVKKKRKPRRKEVKEDGGENAAKVGENSGEANGEEEDDEDEEISDEEDEEGGVEEQKIDNTRSVIKEDKGSIYL